MNFFSGKSESQESFEKGQEMAKEYAGTIMHETARGTFLDSLVVSDTDAYKEGFDSVANNQSEDDDD